MFEVRSKAQEVLICLQQEDRRSRRKDGEGENLPIGFEVLKVRRAVVQKKKKNHVTVKNDSDNPGFASASLHPGGGEPQHPGAARGGAGGQLSLHGLSQCDTEEHPGAGSLRGAAHHLPARCSWTLPPPRLFPLSRLAQVTSPAVAEHCGVKRPTLPLLHESPFSATPAPLI